MCKIHLSAAFDEQDLMQAISCWDHTEILKFFKQIELIVADVDFAVIVIGWGRQLEKEFIKDDVDINELLQP